MFLKEKYKTIAKGKKEGGDQLSEEENHTSRRRKTSSLKHLCNGGSARKKTNPSIAKFFRVNLKYSKNIRA
jgi:hypothetical protein